MEDFGKSLRHFRKSRRMTQTELASAVGVAPAYVSQIESSLRVPSLRVARRIAEVLHVGLPALLGTPAERTSRDRLSDIDRLELLRALVRGVEQDLESRPVREDVETYPASKAARLASTPHLVVRSYAFRAMPATAAAHTHEGEETVYCACGRALVRVGDEEHVLTPGSIFRFDASQPHAVLGTEGTVVISTASPPPTVETLRRLPATPVEAASAAGASRSARRA